MKANALGPLALAALSALAALAAPAAPIPVRGATWQWCFKDPGLDFCLRTADAMASLGYNAVMPEFGPVLQSRHYQSPRATFSRGDFRAFLRRAKERNLEVIPLLNALGHSERSIPWPKPLGGGLDLREEENYAFLFNVLDEYLEDFAACGLTPRCLHLGCDEASSTLLANAEKYGSTPEALLLSHLLRLREYCQSKSLGMIVWHDMLMSADDPLYDQDMGYHKTTSWKCRPDVPRDIVLMYWCYEPRSHYGVVTGLVNEGFEVWLCPWGREGMQRMANQAREENLPAVIVSTWMDSGGADVRRLSQTRWMVESLAETPTRALFPESCLDEPQDDPVLRYIGALFPERDIAFRPPPATNAAWRALAKPGYLARLAPGAALLGKWPLDETNFAELTAPYSVTCSNGTGRFSIDLANVARGAGQRVLYTGEHGLSTQCNGMGGEVAVGPLGFVREVTEWGVGDTGIPAGGFVVSWHAEGGYGFLRGAMKVGDAVELVGANGVRFQAGFIDGGESSLTLSFGGGRTQRVSFLWAAGRALPMDGQPVGKVALDYADGTEAEIDLAFGRDVACWDDPLLYWGGRDGVSVWPAFPESAGRHTGKALTGWSWRNPHPEKDVLGCRVELTGAGREMGLLVAGVEMSRLLVADVGTQMAVTDDAFSYALDTVSPVAVKAAADMPMTLWRASGDAVAAVAPDGTPAAVAGSSWRPSAGGLWTLRRRNAQGGAEDTALFTVRHGLFGTQGGGTAASPAKIVDADELIDYGAGIGYVFSLEGAGGLLAALRLPADTLLEDAGGGLWRIATVFPGCLHVGAAFAFAVDSKLPGPNRKARTRDTLRFAYTGDNWSRRTPAASTLTFVAPSGATEARELTGTGIEPMRLREPGLWQVLLAYAGRTLDAEISIVADATTLISK